MQELLSMRVSQIDLGQRVIRLEPGTTKNKEGREVLMTNAILQLLTALVGRQAGGRLRFHPRQRKAGP